MKKILNFFCLLSLLTGCHSCHLTDPAPKPKTELEKLPPATQEGKETFGCLVNGKAFYTTSATNAGGDYQNGHLYIYGMAFFDKSESISFYLSETPTDILTTGNYDLMPSSLFDPWVTFTKDGVCLYGGSTNREDIISGTLTITKFDKINFIISGLFEFTTHHTGCDPVHITDGRFDIHYAP